MHSELKFISLHNYSSVSVMLVILLFAAISVIYSENGPDTGGIIIAAAILLTGAAGVAAGLKFTKKKEGSNYIIELIVPLLLFLLFDFLFSLAGGREAGVITKIYNDFMRAGISDRMNKLLAAALMILFLRLTTNDQKNYALRVSLMIPVLLLINYSGITYFYTLLTSFAVVIAARAHSHAVNSVSKYTEYPILILSSLFLSATLTGIILSFFMLLNMKRMDWKGLVTGSAATISGFVIFRNNIFTDTLGLFSGTMVFILPAALILIVYLGWLTVSFSEVYFYSGIVAFLIAVVVFLAGYTTGEVFLLAMSSVLPLFIASAEYYRVDRYLGRILA